MNQLSYYLHASGNYHVTLIGTKQTISLCPGFFIKHVGIHKNAVVGCLPVTSELSSEIGFNVVKELVMNAI